MKIKMTHKKRKSKNFKKGRKSSLNLTGIEQEPFFFHFDCHVCKHMKLHIKRFKYSTKKKVYFEQQQP